MKTTNFRRLSVLVLAILLMTTTILCGTFAKYVTTTEGTATVEVAKWSFQVNDNTANADKFDLTLTPDNYKNVSKINNSNANSAVAPGTTGRFAIEASNLSEVDVTYTVSFTVTDKPAKLEFFYSNAAGTAAGTKLVATSTEGNETTYTLDLTNAGITGVDGKLAATTSTAVEETITIFWAWDYGTDVVDNADQDKTMSVTVTVTGTQDTPDPETNA